LNKKNLKTAKIQILGFLKFLKKNLKNPDFRLTHVAFQSKINIRFIDILSSAHGYEWRGSEKGVSSCMI